MPPRRKRKKPVADTMLGGWTDVLPPALWRVCNDKLVAGFVCTNMAVIEDDRTVIHSTVTETAPILKSLRSKPLMDALKTCWDRKCTTTLIDEDEA